MNKENRIYRNKQNWSITDYGPAWKKEREYHKNGKKVTILPAIRFKAHKKTQGFIEKLRGW